jgi:hypothetical protein
LPISTLISFAAVELRCARARTSEATTAKPRPCSPARAASTAAFSASRLVWKAIPSMTPTISAIFFDASWIPPMVSTTRPTICPPLSAFSAALLAMLLADLALSAVCFTILVISSTLATTSSSEEACSSLRWERSVLPLAISSDAWLTTWAPSRMLAATSCRLLCMRSSAVSRRPVSSCDPASISPVRSPEATRSVIATALPSGRVMPRASHRIASTPATRAATSTTAI